MKMKYSILAVVIAFFAMSCSNDDNGDVDSLTAQDIRGDWTVQSYSNEYSHTSTDEEGDKITKKGKESLSPEGNVSFTFAKSGQLIVAYSDAEFRNEYTDEKGSHVNSVRPNSTELGTWKLLEEKGQLAIKGFHNFDTETAMDIVSYSESRMELQADLSPSEEDDNQDMDSHKLVLTRK